MTGTAASPVGVDVSLQSPRSESVSAARRICWSLLESELQSRLNRWTLIQDEKQCGRIYELCNMIRWMDLDLNQKGEKC